MAQLGDLTLTLEELVAEHEAARKRISELETEVQLLRFTLTDRSSVRPPVSSARETQADPTLHSPGISRQPTLPGRDVYEAIRKSNPALRAQKPGGPQAFARTLQSAVVPPGLRDAGPPPTEPASESVRSRPTDPGTHRRR